MPRQEEHIEEIDSPVNEIVGRTPNRLIRYGSGVIFLMIAIVIALCFVIKYPDVIETTLVVTDQNAPQPVLAKVSKRVEAVWLEEGQQVEKGARIALLESLADVKQVNALSHLLHQLESHIDSLDYVLSLDTLLIQYDSLGTLQENFNQFQFKLMDYQMFIHDGFSKGEQENLLEKIKHAKAAYQNLLNQKALLNQELRIIEQDYKDYEQLAAEGLISQRELEQQNAIVINKQLSIQQLEGQLLQAKSGQLSLQDQSLQFDKALYQAQNQLRQSIQSLEEAIHQWMDVHIIYAMSAGKLVYSNRVESGTMLQANQAFAYVLTGDQNVIGEIMLPQFNMGKIELGQTVNVKFQSYTHTEFGVVLGKVKSIAEMVDQQGMYRIEVVFENGLKTTYHKEIPFKNGMMANAEIITEDQYVIQRIFYQFKEIFQ